MSKVKYKISIVTVTYGNRWPVLKQVVQQVLKSEQVGHMIIVNNASGYHIDNKVSELADSRITVINNLVNTGSAGGYYAGITYAYGHTDSNFIFLLDDDNLPAEDDIFNNLLKHWDAIEGKNDQKALFCLRTDRENHIKIARGDDAGRYFLVPDNFLGFSILKILRNQYQKLFGAAKTGPMLSKVQMPYVPYGGLFMHRDMIAAIGYPDERFYLYVDDSEYTYRITRNGGKIWLVPECSIIDIDRSQGVGYKSKPFHSHLLDQWNFRIYYHVRNRMYFYSTVAIKNKFIFTLNKALYLACLKAISLLSSKQPEYKKFLGAVNDGLNGKLGKADEAKI